MMFQQLRDVATTPINRPIAPTNTNNNSAMTIRPSVTSHQSNYQVPLQSIRPQQPEMRAPFTLEMLQKPNNYVADCFINDEWQLELRRNFDDWKVGDICQLLQLLEPIILDVNKEDYQSWEAGFKLCTIT
ncbi:hypothetical protein HAX54_018674 [Datura stramonium]|uniref:Uncharacterized protein n=1 Tax=Datura stramonium TaxID=4076 RepID=A0ABS8UPZ5_DATST|nr:hypothetical protein [Datura stramonium]